MIFTQHQCHKLSCDEFDCLKHPSGVPPLSVRLTGVTSLWYHAVAVNPRCRTPSCNEFACLVQPDCIPPTLSALSDKYWHCGCRNMSLICRCPGYETTLHLVKKYPHYWHISCCKWKEWSPHVPLYKIITFGGPQACNTIHHQLSSHSKGSYVWFCASTTST